MDAKNREEVRRYIICAQWSCLLLFIENNHDKAIFYLNFSPALSAIYESSYHYSS